jgi:hypothetical protein
MTIQTPTRITIEIQPATSGGDTELRVLQDNGAAPALPITIGSQREGVPLPARYEPGPCLCLDDEDCGADHGNE